MPITAKTAKVPNIIEANFPCAVFHRFLDLNASQVAGIIDKLHMSNTMAAGLMGTTVSITMVM